MIDFDKLIGTARLRVSSRPGRTILTESESDRGRILFSPAFRRLQQKAQVFSLEQNAAVRSRLTHSLEVSQIGRYLTDEICQLYFKRPENKIDGLLQGSIINFVEAACLMHDIGNPPFGHFGETAIQEWFRTNGEDCLLKATRLKEAFNSQPNPHRQAVDRALADFYDFDGNPQGLRIVTRLQWNTDEYGLNLTTTTLASYLKYIRCAADNNKTGNFKKKPGYFTTEEDIIKEVWDSRGYSTAQRYPLAYIMEAADDIAYCISDLEDAIEKKIVISEIAFSEVHKMYISKCAGEDFQKNHPTHLEIISVLESTNKLFENKKPTFTDFRTKINNILVKYAAEIFVKNDAEILSGKLATLLPENEPPGAILRVLKDFCTAHVYTHRSVQKIELAGYNAITGLLEQFKPLLTATHERFQSCLDGKKADSEGVRVLIEPKLLKLFPENYIKVYLHHIEKNKQLNDPKFAEWTARAHLIVDYISGMTDDFAMSTYRILAGMELQKS